MFKVFTRCMLSLELVLIITKVLGLHDLTWLITLLPIIIMVGISVITLIIIGLLVVLLVIIIQYLRDEEEI